MGAVQHPPLATSAAPSTSTSHLTRGLGWTTRGGWGGGPVGACRAPARPPWLLTTVIPCTAMSPLPTIPGVFRTTLLWNSFGGVEPRNVLHFSSLLSDPMDVGLAVLQTFHDSRAAFEPFELVSSVFHFDSVEVLPLDGVSAGVIATDATALCNGQDTGNPIPALAAIVSLKTSQRGARGRGRLYAGPAGESKQSGGFFAAVDVGHMQTAWDDFLAAMSGNGVNLCIASYAHEDFHVVTSAHVELTGGTQRRRQTQLR